MSTANLTFLDCTLRDGGYYNDWTFEEGLVNRYLSAMDRCGIDVVEIGFRTFGQAGYLGPYGHTTDRHLASLDLPSRARLAVMVNVGDAVGVPEGPKDVIGRLFAPRDRSPVSVVRFAGHLHDLDTAIELARAVADLGYEPVVNLMQVSRQPADVLAEAMARLSAADVTSVVYIADSLGDLRPAEVTALVERLGSQWGGELGFHAHDNCRLGVANALAAVEAGATWVDATVRGMGRGAGNAQTEFLAPLLGRLTGTQRDVSELASLAMIDFAALQEEFGWGPDLLYLQAAERGIHPTYVQMLEGDDRYDLGDMLSALDVLGGLPSHSYRATQLESALSTGGDQGGGAWDPMAMAAEEFLLLAPGPSGFQHATAIERLIRERQPSVLALNSTFAVDASLVSAIAACHPSRLLLEADRLAKVDRPVIAPRSSLEALGGLDMVDCLDYGCVVREGAFEVHPLHCVLPSRLAFGYALAIAARAGASRILVAGADGYPPSDPRQTEMVALLDAFETATGIPVVSLTPTTYPVVQSSVYAPEA